MPQAGQDAGVNLWRDQSWKKRASVVAAGSALVLLGGCGLGYAVTDVPKPSAFSTKQALQLLYADGTPMARFGTNRVLVPLSKVSPAAQHAVLAAEDRDFYSEPGISPKGIARAMFSNVKGGGVEQGGSTITQQYAKNAFLTQERTFSRKIKEVFIALKMSQTVSKDQILEDYLNTIYFGRGAFGIEAAASTYFGPGVHASQLTAAQGAVLASSIRSPAAYDPERHPQRAKARWEYVLNGMLKKGWLTQEQRAAATYPKVAARTSTTTLAGDLDHVRDQVVADLERHGFAEDTIAAGGLVVTTTIQKKAQDAARQAIHDALPATKTPDAPVGALVAIQPGTGRVVAYYGGATAGGLDYADSSKGVEPGSSMKPYVLAAALENGKKVSDQYDGRSPQDVCGDKVSNDAGDPPFGQVDLATALAYSVNTVYTRLACDVGPKKVVALAHKAGITTPLDGEGSVSQQVALGSGGYQVRPLDHADGYATFAANGVQAAPYFVIQVKDRHGNVVYKAKDKTTKAFSPDVAADAIFAMQKVVSEGTGTRARIPGRPTAGKTGTTTGNKNAWFCGFTPQLATAVWVGRPGGKPLTGIPGYPHGVYGGTIPAKIFRTFMTAALEGQPVKQFPKPTGATSTPTATATATATSTPTPSSTPTLQVTLPPVVPTKKPHGSPTPPPPSPTASPTPSAAPSPAAS
jgi:membrane peptidoglycan carboxypeptidase